MHTSGSLLSNQVSATGASIVSTFFFLFLKDGRTQAMLAWAVQLASMGGELHYYRVSCGLLGNMRCSVFNTLIVYDAFFHTDRACVRASVCACVCVRVFFLSLQAVSE